MRDQELTRANLECRRGDKGAPDDNKENGVLPLEETKLIAWQSDDSEDDGFETVLSKKKKQWKKSATKNKKSRSPEPQPAAEGKPLGEGVPMISSRYNLRKHCTINTLKSKVSFGIAEVWERKECPPSSRTYFSLTRSTLLASKNLLKKTFLKDSLGKLSPTGTLPGTGFPLLAEPGECYAALNWTILM